MGVNNSGFGLDVTLVASVTFPIGINLTQFADNADPFDLPEMTINETAAGLNGDLTNWATASPVLLTLNVLPNSDDDRNLAVLFDVNRPGKGLQIASDIITLVGVYPDGKVISLNNGVMVSGMPGNSIGSDRRMKAKAYGFSFENYVRT